MNKVTIICLILISNLTFAATDIKSICAKKALELTLSMFKADFKPLLATIDLKDAFMYGENGELDVDRFVDLEGESEVVVGGETLKMFSFEVLTMEYGDMWFRYNVQTNQLPRAAPEQGFPRCFVKSVEAD